MAAKALNQIFTTYRYPLYSFLRIDGMKHEDAEDVLQEFFAKLLRNDSLRTAEQDRGKLRTFLQGALSRFRINWHRDRQRARGPESAESDLWDEEEARFQREQHGTEENPETFFDRRWAIDLVHKAKGTLREMYERKEKLPLHDTLAHTLAFEGVEHAPSQAVLATQLGTTENALRVTLSRFRADFRECLIEEVKLTVKDESEVKDEIAYLVGLFERR